MKCLEYEAYKVALLKEVSIETIRRLPDDSSLEDIMYEIDFVAQVFKGFKMLRREN